MQSLLFLIILVVTIAGINSCKDFEDCRSIYTNDLYIKFKFKNNLEVKNNFYIAELDKTYSITSGNENIWVNLNSKKTNLITVPLHPQKNQVTCTFYEKASQNNAPIKRQVIIFYHTKSALISPHCGLQQQYLVDSLLCELGDWQVTREELLNVRYWQNLENTPNVEIFD